MNDVSGALITGIFSIIGTSVGAIVGGIVSLFVQIFYEYRKEKKDRRYHLIRLHGKIAHNITETNNTTQFLLNFIKIDIKGLDDFEFDELYTNINSSVEKCSLLWKGFWAILTNYMPKITKGKKFNSFETVMELINYEYIITKLDKMIKPTREMLATRQELLSKSKQDILDAKLFLNDIRKEYNKILFSDKQKNLHITRLSNF